ncbi:diguanylate cyclase [Aquipseudomonas guryensis]|uniref:diguanylate cyclase n=1 Tax=Aquipseudomonas guryensis TaxID=2759165 RepID=A0A7W4DF48_9GAMM|nr:diguanylate cyclase [Pseudomonas guryensis]MBB1521460.1 diguanylate cyclase [Pseudomonas guryensis]
MDKRQQQLADLQVHLQQLGEQFAQRLREELPQLADKAQQLQQAAEPGEQLAYLGELREQLHKLAGSAGTFGFTELGQRARELELQTQQWLNSLQLQQQGLQAFVEALQQLASSHQQAATPRQQASASNTLSKGARAESVYRIYILEDQAKVGETIRLTLNTFGYEARHFLTAAELDAALVEGLPDALIVDVNLGSTQQSGLEYAAALQKRLEEPLPLLVITTQYDFHTQLQAARIGAMGFFSKPVDVAKLESRLERCFAQQSGEPYRVLIVDDDRDLSNRYSLVLRGADMLVEVVNDPQQLFEAMARFNPEVLLLDVNMPDCSGPELAQMVRFNDDWLRVPIIYLSAETDIALQMRALIKAGDDFVTKPISDNSLIATVFARAQRARLLSNALSRDSLTGLLKHADIKEQVAIEQERAQRSGKPVSVVMLDIDHFKQVNDSHGHAVGDNVIRALANLLRQRLRRIDSLGRYGGEEFMAVLPDCTGEQALHILDGIRQQFSLIRFAGELSEFSVSLSAGVACGQGLSAAELMEQADRALYQAKTSGRNLVRLATEN